jgi:3-deoxy-D-manno-octulosonic-acid transferase
MPIYFLYNFLLLVFSPFVALYLAQRYVSGKSKPGWRERWGRLPQEVRTKAGGCPRVWVHAVSAGEVVAAVPILRELRARLPHHEIVLSVITPAGHEMAEQQATPFVDHLFYAPFDLPWVTRQVVRLIQPQIYVSLESELWPNLLHDVKRCGASTVMVNGRISEKNFRRASRMGGMLFRWMLGHVDRLLMQSEADAERVKALGQGMTAPGRVAVLGNSKFDQEIARLDAEQTAKLRHDLKLPANAPVFVAGSTRSPEEEAQIWAAYKQMRQSVADLCLIVAPRQINRAEEVQAAMQAEGLSPVRRSQIEAAKAPVSHLILDTMGELANVYAVASITFVGNSFPPVVKGGGQNLIQPLAHGKPVFFGTHIATIRAEAALAQGVGVGLQVQDGTELAAQALTLLQNPVKLTEIETKAIALIAANRGVSARYAEQIVSLLQNRADWRGRTDA